MDKKFRQFQTSAFRLETLPLYDVGDEKEMYEKYLATGRVDVSFATEWDELVRKNIAAGKTMKRLRLVSEPLTDYEAFEMEVYKRVNIPAGEDVRIMQRQTFGDNIPHDFWLFDDRDLLIMDYNENGVFLSSKREELTSENKDLYLSWLSIFENAGKLQ